MRRDPAVGAAALFHVATSADLAHPAVGEQFGGGLYADTAGTAFTRCGKHPALCGRMSAYTHPYSLWSGSVVREPAAAARGPLLGRQLWSATRSLLGSSDSSAAPLTDAAAEATQPPRRKLAATSSSTGSMVPPADAFEEDDEFSGV